MNRKGPKKFAAAAEAATTWKHKTRNLYSVFDAISIQA